jgi:hypothetical protein
MKYGLVFVLLIAGCDEPVDTGDAGSMGDSGSTDRDAGNIGAECGPATCGRGEVCCNASCGTCVLPGEGCDPGECLPDGGPSSDGGMVGRCGDDDDCGGGSTCCQLDCDGALGCVDGFGCPEILCPSPCEADGTACEAGEYCDYPDGACWVFGDCAPIPEDCTGTDPVCGCDFTDYSNRCEAAAAGVDVEFEGTCEEAICAPMDATSEGDCDAIAGYAWDGGDCSAIACRCAGIDCDFIYATRDECLDSYWDCTGPPCGGITGVRCGTGEFCDYRDGDMCGAFDATGVCHTLPSTCDSEVSPVCACDGGTYDNDCLAHRAGTDTNVRTACGFDCRTAPCPDERYCADCDLTGAWRCVAPDEPCLFEE